MAVKGGVKGGLLSSLPFLGTVAVLSCQTVTDGTKHSTSAATPKPCNCKMSALEEQGKQIPGTRLMLWLTCLYIF